MSVNFHTHNGSVPKFRWYYPFFVFNILEIGCLLPQWTTGRQDNIRHIVPSKLLENNDFIYINNTVLSDELINQQDALYISDTLTQDDLVKKHYLSLPYPLPSRNMLEKEYMYYKNMQKQKKHIPYQMIYGKTLERINHFLFKGRNQFKYEIMI